MADNPYEVSDDLEMSQPDGITSPHATYNVVSDTVVGLNLRKSDNKLQLKVILVSVPLFAFVGMVLAIVNPRWDLPWFGGLMIGSFAGMIIGTFASGLYLMIYRAFRHMEGEHD